MELVAIDFYVYRNSKGDTYCNINKCNLCTYISSVFSCHVTCVISYSNKSTTIIFIMLLLELAKNLN